jgi:hypothetical protein
LASSPSTSRTFGIVIAIHPSAVSREERKEDSLKRIIFAIFVLIGALTFVSPRALAQGMSPQQSAPTGSDDSSLDGQVALLRKDLRSMKKQLIAANLVLTDTEATQFWPLYEQYSADLDKINDTRTAIIKEYAEAYGTQTDEQASTLIRRWLEADISIAQLRRKYLGDFEKVLPGKKAATFFQLDRRISMMIDLQLTLQLPLAQSQD